MTGRPKGEGTIGKRFRYFAVLGAALSPDLGYYDVPRRVSSEELAKRLKIQEPTLVMHRRKAERRLLAALIEKS
jgi:predicted DNA binding protein